MICATFILLGLSASLVSAHSGQPQLERVNTRAVTPVDKWLFTRQSCVDPGYCRSTQDMV